ncbi:hypothetical protein C2E23DRAFT_526202 [Lenzites betulinus]|nr:hypothetical protein C2E23DRAFT_526202 [Lenzites betulinus]
MYVNRNTHVTLPPIRRVSQGLSNQKDHSHDASWEARRSVPLPTALSGSVCKPISQPVASQTHPVSPGSQRVPREALCRIWPSLSFKPQKLQTLKVFSEATIERLAERRGRRQAIKGAVSGEARLGEDADLASYVSGPQPQLSHRGPERDEVYKPNRHPRSAPAPLRIGPHSITASPALLTAEIRPAPSARPPRAFLKWRTYHPPTS